MIALCLDIIGTQHISQVLYLLSRQAVDDATLARMLFNKTHDILINVLRLGPYFVIQVRTVKRTLELGGIENAETLLDICTHLIGGSSSQSDDRRLAYFVDDRTDSTVLWAEIMSPL